MCRRTQGYPAGGIEIGKLFFGRTLVVEAHEEAEDLPLVAVLWQIGKAKSKAIGAGPIIGIEIRRPKPGATRTASTQLLIRGCTVPASTNTTPRSMSSAVIGNRYWTVLIIWKSPPMPMP